MADGYESKRARAEGYASKLLDACAASIVPVKPAEWSVAVAAHMEGQRDTEERLEAALAAAVEQRQRVEAAAKAGKALYCRLATLHSTRARGAMFTAIDVLLKGYETDAASTGQASEVAGNG